MDQWQRPDCRGSEVIVTRWIGDTERSEVAAGQGPSRLWGQTKARTLSLFLLLSAGSADHNYREQERVEKETEGKTYCNKPCE